MNKILSILLITISILFLTALKIKANILNQADLAIEIKNQAQTIIKKEIKSKVIVDVDDFYLHNISIPNKNYKIQLTCNCSKFNPITIFKVNILSNGNILKTFGIPVRISIFETVAVASKNISKNDPLSSDNIKYETREISLINNNTLTLSDSLDLFSANRPFKEGEALDKRFIKTPPDVLMYNPVSLIFKNDDITVSIEGEALDSGKIGEYIRVKNKTYKKQYQGQIIDKNKVLVKI